LQLRFGYVAAQQAPFLLCQTLADPRIFNPSVRGKHLPATIALRNLGRRQANDILETRKAA
jgi:hypothetical protein